MHLCVCMCMYVSVCVHPCACVCCFCHCRCCCLLFGPKLSDSLSLVITNSFYHSTKLFSRFSLICVRFASHEFQVLHRIPSTRQNEVIISSSLCNSVLTSLCDLMPGRWNLLCLCLSSITRRLYWTHLLRSQPLVGEIKQIQSK